MVSEARRLSHEDEVHAITEESAQTPLAIRELGGLVLNSG